MEYWNTWRLKFMNKRLLFYSILFFSSICALVCTISSNTPFLDTMSPLTGKTLFFREFKKSLEKMHGEEIIKRSSGDSLSRSTRTKTRRFLSGPGSWPPRCTWKCGSCTPCKPVHVPVPPGTPVTAEYYPEAWRCKCGNKLYMP